MTLDTFTRANKIMECIKGLKNKNSGLEVKVDRFNDYIEWMDGRHQPVIFANKIYKKVDIRFNMSNHPTETDVRDLFDLVEENKKDFIDFLKKCQNNYKKQIESNNVSIKKLEEEFNNLSDEQLEETA